MKQKYIWGIRPHLLSLCLLIALAVMLAACGSDTPPAESDPPAETAGETPAEVQEPAAVPSTYNEAPMLAELVASGELPPVDERLPANPYVIEPFGEIGQYGDQWVTLIGSGSDTKLAYVYGHVRLVDWDRSLSKIVPELAESFEVKEGRDFTFTLREGLKWSDGAPFTTEDVRFWWEDDVNNEELSAGGIPSTMLVDGQGPEFTIVDDYTFNITWEKPNTVFLNLLAASTDLHMFLPSHYMKQFHIDYGDPDEIQAMVEAEGFENWAALYSARERHYDMDNPDMPTLQPWVPTTVPPAEKLDFVRNPYFFAVDPAGNQLPYLDKFVALLSEPDLVVLKTTQGDADLQQRTIGFADITLLSESEAQGDYEVRLWPTAVDAIMKIQPNLTYNDEVMREVMRDKRFRQALSHAIDRDEINQVLFVGYGTPMQPELVPSAEGYNEAYATADLEFDLDRANALLDEMGLTERNADGVRLLPNGEPLVLVVEDAGENPIFADLMELITSTWEQVGLQVLYRSTERATFRTRVQAGEVMIGLWGGQDGNNWLRLQGGPYGRLPMDDGTDNLWGTGFGLWKLTGGEEGMEPPDVVKRLQDLGDAYMVAGSDEELQALVEEMRQIYAEERFEIGTIGNLPTPIVVKNYMRNVPQEGLVAWDPGGYLGWTEPAQYWKATE